MSIKTTHDIKKDEIHVQMEASEDQLVAGYNEQARAVRTLQATVDLIPTTGSTYSGVIEEYHDVPGFILAERPATVRIIGQAPVVAKNIFDMVADEKEFRYYILTLLRQAEAGKLTIARKIWYNRTDLHASRVQIFGEGGKLESDISYS